MIKRKIEFKEIHLALFLLLIGIFIIYILFIKEDIINHLDQKITFIIASFGVLFSGIQIWMGSIRSKNEFLKNMRYEEYKRTRELINRFFNCFSDNMGQEQNIHLLDKQLVSINNELVIIIATSNNSIFKGITDVKEIDEFGKIAGKIIVRTDKLRFDIDKLKKNNKSIDFAIEVEIMNWHNEIIEKIQCLHELKYHIFEFMEKRII